MQRLYPNHILTEIRRKIFIQLRKYFLVFSKIRNNFAIKAFKVRFVSIEQRGTCIEQRGTCIEQRGTCIVLRGTCIEVHKLI